MMNKMFGLPWGITTSSLERSGSETHRLPGSPALTRTDFARAIDIAADAR
jgi:hypothetical protein